MKTKIFYIAYKTCESLFGNRNISQIHKAKILIATNIAIHISQIVLLGFLALNKKLATINVFTVLIFCAIYVLSTIGVLISYNRKILAKSIAKYKNSDLGTN